MARLRTDSRLMRLGLGIGIALALSAAVAGIAVAQGPATTVAPPAPSRAAAECLACHDDPTLKMTLPSGETLSLNVPADSLHTSVHGELGIECQSCHPQLTGYPHPAIPFATGRELSRSYYQACQRCHPDNYRLTQDSMHAQAATAGNLDAPICTDCHSAHDVQPPAEPRAHISQTCGQCHESILQAYSKSVHGSALLRDDNPDVPVCTDCHGVHNIQDPRTALFRIETPEMCAGCHANRELMGRYGHSADVYSLYSLSWHGVDVSVYKAIWPTIWHDRAVCTDCHGVHDILKTTDPASRVNPANLLTTCRQCHPDAGPNWTGAWTGHYQVSMQRTPFVFYTQAFYDSFAPFVLWMSAGYVFLQILRATVERIRRSMR